MECMVCLLTRTEEPGRLGATRSDLSPACPVASQHLCTPHERSLGFSSLHTCRSSSPTSQGRLVSTTQGPRPGRPSLACLAHSQGQVSTHTISLFLVPSQGRGSRTNAFLPVLAGYVSSCSLGCTAALPVST